MDRLPLTIAASVPSTSATQAHAQRVAYALWLMERYLPLCRHMIRAGQQIYQTGMPFASLHIINAGLFKLIIHTPDGRDRVVGLRFKGDWLGFDGIGTERHDCDAIAMDVGELWSVRYDAVLQACSEHPALLSIVHRAMSQETARDRDWLLSLNTLSTDARVAEFLRYWAESLARRGLRTDQITLRLTRAEIGSFLGMSLESASRALSRLARNGLIHFAQNHRREIQIPDVRALSAFARGSVEQESTDVKPAMLHSLAHLRAVNAGNESLH